MPRRTKSRRLMRPGVERIDEIDRLADLVRPLTSPLCGGRCLASGNLPIDRAHRSISPRYGRTGHDALSDASLVADPGFAMRRWPSMGPGIVIPVLIVTVVVPVVLLWARRRFKEVAAVAAATSELGSIPACGSPATPCGRCRRRRGGSCTRSPPIGSAESTTSLIGPPGVFADHHVDGSDAGAPPSSEPIRTEVAAAAISAATLDDALRRCAMTTDRLVVGALGVNRRPRHGERRVVPGVDRRRRGRS